MIRLVIPTSQAHFHKWLSKFKQILWLSKSLGGFCCFVKKLNFSLRCFLFVAVFVWKHTSFTKQLLAQLYSPVRLAFSVTAFFPQLSHIISDHCLDESVVGVNNKQGQGMVSLTGSLFHTGTGWEQTKDPRLSRLAGTGNFNGHLIPSFLWPIRTVVDLIRFKTTFLSLGSYK